MTGFVARRLLLVVPTLFGVLAAAFLLLEVAPGDPVQEMVGERADSLTIARLRAELHLDDPLPLRFGRYVVGLLRRCGGNISRAARLAKKDRKDFYDVIRRTGVDPTEFR